MVEIDALALEAVEAAAGGDAFDALLREARRPLDIEPRQVAVTASAIQDAVRHAREVRPVGSEATGAFAVGRDGVAREYIRLENKLAHVPGKAHWTLPRLAAGESVVPVHSHPSGPAHPSRGDLEGALPAWLDEAYVIVQRKTAEVAAYRLGRDRKTYTKLRLKVAPDDAPARPDDELEAAVGQLVVEVGEDWRARRQLLKRKPAVASTAVVSGSRVAVTVGVDRRGAVVTSGAVWDQAVEAITAVAVRRVPARAEATDVP